MELRVVSVATCRRGAGPRQVTRQSDEAKSLVACTAGSSQPPSQLDNRRPALGMGSSERTL
jgi:hypothetical protein